MKRKTIGGVILLAVLGGSLLWQWRVVSKTREDNAKLRALAAEAEQLAAENAALEKQRPPVESVDVSRSELLRLRSEAGRLRSQKLLSPEALQADNARLRAELASGQIKPRRIADMDGFVPKEKWTRAGFATPEAALESFLWAIQHRDIEYLLQSVPPSIAKDLRAQMAQQAEHFLTNELSPFQKMTGFLLKERKDLREDKVQLGLQVAADGAVFPFTVRRENGEWKVDPSSL